MSRERSNCNRRSSVKRKEQRELFDHDEQESIAAYLRTTARRDNHRNYEKQSNNNPWKHIKNVQQDSYGPEGMMGNVLFPLRQKNSDKENQFMGKDQSIECNYKRESKGLIVGQKWLLEQVERLIDQKLPLFIQRHLDHLLKQQTCSNQQQSIYTSHLQQMSSQLATVEEQYLQMSKKYDYFLKTIIPLTNIPKSIDKFIAKADFQKTIGRVTRSIESMQSELEHYSSRMEDRISERMKKDKNKIEPISLRDKEQQVTKAELRVVVDTFNENFIRIDGKIRDMMNYTDMGDMVEQISKTGSEA